MDRPWRSLERSWRAAAAADEFWGYLFESGIVERLQAPIEAQRLLHEGQLEMQARLETRFGYASELQKDCGLPFGNNENAVDAEQDDRGDDDAEDRTHVSSSP